jgi:hypothetical protein
VQATAFNIGLLLRKLSGWGKPRQAQGRLSAIQGTAFRNTDMSTVANVTGQWDVTINSPLGTRHVKGIFKQEGETISGSLRSAERELATHGTLNGSAISLTYTVQLDGSDVPIGLTGLVDGDFIKGSAEFGSGDQGDWAAKRVGGATAETASTNEIDVSGTWIVEIETSSGTASPTFTFKQKGQQLTGQYKGAFSEGPLSGTITGNKIAFSFKAEDESMTFDGAIQDNAMVGTAKLGQLGPGTWTAKRQ